LGSTQIDYWCAIYIEKSKNINKKKLFLSISVVLNLLILGFFKYFNFFSNTIVDIASLIGYKPNWTDLNIILPIGISFYTFQSLSYSIDVYRGEIKALKNWVEYSFFNSFFPQLIAGPIIRPKDFLPQIKSGPKIDVKSLNFALIHIFRGLLKKIILSDFLAQFADLAFDNSNNVPSYAILIGIYAFTFQIYFDFSGYSDIAIGSARLLGYKIPINFNRPYAAKSVTEFWRRWHISLSLWLKDYLYIPLGGNRVSHKYKVYKNLMITMLLGGLWHGAAWNFVIWGGFQGLALSIEKALKTKIKFKKFIKIILVFHFTVFSWIIFRSDGVSSIIDIFNNLYNYPINIELNNKTIIAIVIIILGFSNQLIDEKYNLQEKFLKLPIYIKTFFYAIIFLVCIIFNSEEIKPFIYFQF
tara:strand:- start:2290 stop:3528 length:1239 start_codon:yes stop_codon:yes gene_type:complete